MPKAFQNFLWVITLIPTTAIAARADGT